MSAQALGCLPHTASGRFGTNTAGLRWRWRVELDRSFLADVERGRRNISIRNLYLIARAVALGDLAAGFSHSMLYLRAARESCAPAESNRTPPRSALATERSPGPASGSLQQYSLRPGAHHPFSPPAASSHTPDSASALPARSARQSTGTFSSSRSR